MDRLTERNPYWMGEEFWTSAMEPDDEEIDKIYEKLWKYENAEEDGLLVRLPCKAGDRIWIIEKLINSGEWRLYGKISIHAPTRGATAILHKIPYLFYFIFTNPFPISYFHTQPASDF